MNSNILFFNYKVFMVEMLKGFTKLILGIPNQLFPALLAKMFTLTNHKISFFTFGYLVYAPINVILGEGEGWVI